MTLIQAIENGRMDLVALWTVYLWDSEGFSQQQIKDLFNKPWKWNSEFAEWYERGGDIV